MTSEADNPEQGTDNAQAQANDTAEELYYDDPEETEDNDVTQDAEATDDGMAAVDEAEAPEEEPANAEIEAAVDAVVTLPNGEKTKVSELIQGNLRQQDYTRKSQELSNQRKALEAEVQRMEGITHAFIDHLEKLVPPAPDYAMAVQDPAGYTQAMAAHQSAMAQLRSLIEIGQQPKQIKESMALEDRSRLAEKENARLAEKFPDVANPKKRAEFFNTAVEAAKELGFSVEELNDVLDHRMFAALHYVAKGLRAEKSMKVAQAKVAKAPPVAPLKPVGKGSVSSNAAAMQKLARSGSMSDALKVDWE